MIVLSNTAAQTLTAGQSMTFNTTLFKSNKCNCCKGLRNAQLNLCQNGNYEISFHANIAGGAATTAVQLAIEVGGVRLPETVMNALSTASGDTYNVSADTLIHNCCGCASIKVVNSGTATVTVNANPSLVIKEV